jgi:tetratricopeptide (TPR) repeat protein
MHDLGSARDAFQNAVKADPKYAPPCVTLALLDLEQKRPKDAVRMADQALQLMPHLAEAHYYRAIASVSLGDIDATEGSLQAIQASPDATRYPRTHFMMANVYLQRRDIKNAARELRTYVKFEPNSRAGKASKKQLAEWEAQGLIQKAP